MVEIGQIGVKLKAFLDTNLIVSTSKERNEALMHQFMIRKGIQAKQCFPMSIFDMTKGNCCRVFMTVGEHL